MEIFKVSLRFTRFADAILVVFVQNLLVALTGNANFATPSPTLASISTLLDNFITALANAADGGKTLNIIKEQQRYLLIAALRLLADYVQDTGNNDEAVLSSSGFTIYGSKHGKRPKPGKATNLRLFDGDYSGSVKAKVNPVLYTKVYELRYTEDAFGPDARWQSLPASTRSLMVISGLTPSKAIWVQVRCINSHGYSDWCDPATIVVK